MKCDWLWARTYPWRQSHISPTKPASASLLFKSNTSYEASPEQSGVERSWSKSERNYNCNKVIVIFYDHVYGHRKKSSTYGISRPFVFLSSSLHLLDNGDVRAKVVNSIACCLLESFSPSPSPDFQRCSGRSSLLLMKKIQWNFFL